MTRLLSCKPLTCSPKRVILVWHNRRLGHGRSRQWWHFLQSLYYFELRIVTNYGPGVILCSFWFVEIEGLKLGSVVASKRCGQDTLSVVKLLGGRGQHFSGLKCLSDKMMCRRAIFGRIRSSFYPMFLQHSRCSICRVSLEDLTISTTPTKLEIVA